MASWWVGGSRSSSTILLPDMKYTYMVSELYDVIRSLPDRGIRYRSMVYSSSWVRMPVSVSKADFSSRVITVCRVIYRIHCLLAVQG
jgi:hypothetical protein